MKRSQTAEKANNMTCKAEQKKTTRKTILADEAVSTAESLNEALPR